MEAVESHLAGGDDYGCCLASAFNTIPGMGITVIHYVYPKPPPNTLILQDFVQLCSLALLRSAVIPYIPWR